MSQWRTFLQIRPIIDKGQPNFLHLRAFGDKGPIIFTDKAFFTDKGLTDVLYVLAWRELLKERYNDAARQFVAEAHCTEHKRATDLDARHVTQKTCTLPQLNSFAHRQL